MSPGNVAGIAAQRRVKCNGLGTEFDSLIRNHAATIQDQVCISVPYDHGHVVPRLIPSIAEAVARIHEAATLSFTPR